jgi:guanylate kinase/deoxycytidine triphosphate deaminase
MFFVISGLKGSGKTTLANSLSNKYIDEFQTVKNCTTREKRSQEDQTNYNFYSKKTFEKKKADGELLIHTEYSGLSYGVEKSEYDKVIRSNKIPILVLSPESFVQFKDDLDLDKFSLFLDNKDSVLKARLDDRKESFNLHLANNDRRFKNHFLYCLDNSNHSIDDFAKIVFELFKINESGGIISAKIILDLINCNTLLSNSTPSNISIASYDLRLGDEYYYQGKITHLSDEKPFLLIDPYDYAILTSIENASLPLPIAGSFGLSISLFCQGMILSNGPQIDPGFNGKLFCLVFNTSNSPIVLKREQHYATIIFNKILRPGPGYSGKYQNKSSIIDYLPPNTLMGGLSDLKKEIENLKKGNEYLQTAVLAIITITLTIIAMILVLG